MDLLLHPETKIALQGSLDSAAHAFILNGPVGSGKLTLARQLAEQLLAVTMLKNQPGFKELVAEKGSIGIDTIRDVQQFLRLKTVGNHRIRRVIVIADAHLMTVEAQNAFLKLLEEPPADTKLILTVATGQPMLPTIHSRAQTLHLKPPTKDQFIDYFKKQGSNDASIQKAYLLSGGRIGLMSALLNDDSDHPLLDYVDRAKQFLSLSTFERLTQLDGFAKNRDELALLLEAIRRMADTAFEQAALQGKTTQAKHWHQIRHSLHFSQSQLAHTPNVKLLLTDLSLNL